MTRAKFNEIRFASRGEPKMIKLKTMVKTCEAFPAQWYGRDKDGKRYYFRFRHGYFRIQQIPVTDCLSGPIVFEWDHPSNGYAGEMGDDQMKELTKDIFDWSETKFFDRCKRQAERFCQLHDPKD